MTVQGLKLCGPKSLIGMLLISVVGVTFRAATAHADDCLAAPNSPAREGTRWYYRLDGATQHKCWYMRPLDQPAGQAAAQAKILPFAIPLPRPRPTAAGSAVSLAPADTASSSSHAEGITAKPSADPPVSGSTDETAMSIPRASASPRAPASLAAPEPSAMPRLGAAIAETSSAISEIHQIATSPETNVEATTPGSDAETLNPTTDEIRAAPQQAVTLSEHNAQVAAPGANAPPQTIAPIDDTASSIPKDYVPERTSSESRSKAAEPAPNVSVAETHAPLAVATVNARPIPLDAPADLASDGRERSALSDEPIHNTGMIRPFYLILAFGAALVGMLHYLIFRYFPGGSRRISIDHAERDYIVDDDPYNNPEFYRKLRQGVVLEQSIPTIG
jgi:hypothetical protein